MSNSHFETRGIDPLDDLTRRLRHPVRWTLAHPFRALRRVTWGR